MKNKTPPTHATFGVSKGFVEPSCLVYGTTVPESSEASEDSGTATIFIHGFEYVWRFGLHVFTRYELQGHLENMLRRATAEFDFCPAVDVFFVRDGLMRTMNREHLHCHSPTNILSFPAAPPAFPLDKPKASLIVSVDTVEREAMLYGKTIKTYLFFLLAHGIGHLMGFEHSTEMDTFCSTLLP